MNPKYHLSWFVISVLLVTVAMYRIRELQDGVSSLRSKHERVCSLLQTRLQGAVVELKREDYDHIFVEDAFREVVVYADTCVALPPATMAYVESFDPDKLREAVIALDRALTQ